MSRWRTHAEKVITKALAEAEAQALDEKATLALVDSRYPFGERAYHPYQMWLKVRRELVPSLRAKQAEKVKVKTAKVKDAWREDSGQSKLELPD
jgi:hypothetical protein